MSDHERRIEPSGDNVVVEDLVPVTTGRELEAYIYMSNVPQSASSAMRDYLGRSLQSA